MDTKEDSMSKVGKYSDLFEKKLNFCATHIVQLLVILTVLFVMFAVIELVIQRVFGRCSQEIPSIWFDSFLAVWLIGVTVYFFVVERMEETHYGLTFWRILRAYMRRTGVIMLLLWLMAQLPFVLISFALHVPFTIIYLMITVYIVMIVILIFVAFYSRDLNTRKLIVRQVEEWIKENKNRILDEPYIDSIYITDLLIYASEHSDDHIFLRGMAQLFSELCEWMFLEENHEAELDVQYLFWANYLRKIYQSLGNNGFRFFVQQLKCGEAACRKGQEAFYVALMISVWRELGMKDLEKIMQKVFNGDHNMFNNHNIMLTFLVYTNISEPQNSKEEREAIEKFRSMILHKLNGNTEYTKAVDYLFLWQVLENIPQCPNRKLEMLIDDLVKSEERM